MSNAPAMEAAWTIPPYTSQILSPKKHRYAVCIFVINEAQRIATQLQRMIPLTEVIDILMADGGSTDGSLAEDLLRRCCVRALLTKTGPGKLSAQMRMALAFGLQEGYEGLIVIDGNNKDNPDAIPSFIQALDNGVDHVQGSRYIPGGIAINTPPMRHWGVKLLHAPLISLAAGHRYTDTTNGFRAYSRRLLTDPRIQPFRDCFQAYELHYYLAIQAARYGFNVQELPVERTYPADGAVPTKISKWRGNWFVFRTLLDACRGKFNP